MAPAARRQGVGTALLGACTERARALGLPLTLLVEGGRPSRGTPPRAWPFARTPEDPSGLYSAP
ncbi:GNAT family N-acetyltransferase [Deinococcus murrayi]|uniref:GNAT family N-acetyltransferase n=1 Tax=Deinococcus sp. RL TaxID=1489678 RepID=UPI00316AD704